MIFKNILLAGGVVCIAGCATITRGTEEVLAVNSTPAGAQVQLSDGQFCGATPCRFTLPRKAELDVVISKADCRTQQVRVTNRIGRVGGAAMAGNIVAGGFLGASIDVDSGAMRDLYPNPVEVTLDCD